MLVLTRKPNQQLTIGKDIVITVVKVRGNTIRLGIDAPKDVRVIRSELELRIDNGLTADLETADEVSDRDCLPDAESILTATIVIDDHKADSEVSSTTDNREVAGEAERPRDVQAQSNPGLSNSSSGRSAVTSHIAMKSSNQPAAPLRAFKSTRASQANQHAISAARNLEDSPMCHRSSLGQREQLASQMNSTPLAGRSW